MKKARVEVVYSGRVQGVGFRFTAERLANAAGLKGHVKNLSDGRVELVAEGEEAEIKTLLSEIDQALGRYIDNSSSDWLPATGQLKRFEIRFV